jgi:hypothetical protein
MAFRHLRREKAFNEADVLTTTQPSGVAPIPIASKDASLQSDRINPAVCPPAGSA